MLQSSISSSKHINVTPYGGPRSIVVPTWSGHKDDAALLVESIRAHQTADIDIYLVISEEDRTLFASLAQTYRCSIFTIEELVQEYSGKTISGAALLKMVDRYRFQTLKKFLALARLDGLALLIDSESRIARDLSPIFEGDLAETTVLYSVRPWDKMPRGLAKDAYEECCYLLGTQPFWYFESLNWLYSTEIVRRLLTDLKTRHGVRWMFRSKQLFESQLYFQYAHQKGIPYRFIRAEALLAEHFGETRAVEILSSIYTSPWKAAGIFEYLARFVTREEFAAFIASDAMLRHFRLVRYEPYGFYDVVGQLRQKILNSPYFFGEAAMHRGPFVRGKTAIVLFGAFTVEQDIYNVQRFLAGVDCDIFIALPTNNWLTSLAEDVLSPKSISKQNVSCGLGESNSLPFGDPPDLNGPVLSDLVNAAYLAMRDEEKQSLAEYAVVVTMRPQLASSRHLRDILWDISENASGFANKVFFPNRCWGDGVNGHLSLGLRDPMDRLWKAFRGRVFRADSTIERILGECVMTAKLQPTPFPFQYFLAEDGFPDLRHVTRRYKSKTLSNWSAKVTAPHWKDASRYLSWRLSKNLRPPRRGVSTKIWKSTFREPLKSLERFLRRRVRALFWKLRVEKTKGHELIHNVESVGNRGE